MKTLFSLTLIFGAIWGCTLQKREVDSNSFERDLTTNCDEGDTPPPNRVDTTDRLAALRPLLIDNALTAYIVPLDEEGRRTWISGFSGSNGDSIVTLTEAATWTDGRYFLQAAQELDCNWQLMREGQPGVPTKNEWLKTLPSGSRVGADPTLIGAKTWLDMEEDLATSGIQLISLSQNLIDQIWTTSNGRPEFTPKDVVILDIEFAGLSFEDKIFDLRDKLSADHKDAMVVTEGDEIAWILNLRGEGSSNVEGLMNSPLFQSQLLITPDLILLWMHLEKVTSELNSYFQAPLCAAIKTCVSVNAYENALTDLESWAAAQPQGSKIAITNPSMYLSGASYAVYESIPTEKLELVDSPILMTKADKNPTEVNGMINAHLKDAYAVIGFLAFMEDQITNQGVTTWNEITAADRLLEFREQQQDFRGNSFTTISASGSNGAIIHYTPKSNTVAAINDSAVFLLDSGGQYLDGTTDITRTMHYGTPSAEVIEMYTRVLMGAIDLARAVFPDGTYDRSVDYATRQHIYNLGLDYRHGTGHGIGAYLKVHEGPTRIAMSGTPSSLREDYFFSDEPGYYKDGEYGIRLESIVRVVSMDFPDETFGKFLGLDTITLVPFEPRLIDFTLLTPSQINWYNNYNQKIIDNVRPYFQNNGDVEALAWMDARTQFVDPSIASNDL